VWIVAWSAEELLLVDNAVNAPAGTVPPRQTRDLLPQTAPVWEALSFGASTQDLGI